MIENRLAVSPFDWTAVGRGKQPGVGGRQTGEVAGQFESLLIAQMLSSMRQADGGGWLGCGEDQAGATLTEMAEQCVAQAIAASGGFGLAPIVEQGLGQRAVVGDESSGGAVSHKR